MAQLDGIIAWSSRIIGIMERWDDDSRRTQAREMRESIVLAATS